MYHLSASCVGALHLSPCPQRYGRVCASLANVRDSIVIDAVPFSVRRYRRKHASAFPQEQASSRALSASLIIPKIDLLGNDA
jgi:hypothetical protein